jgi:hypothetical protein
MLSSHVSADPDYAFLADFFEQQGAASLAVVVIDHLSAISSEMLTYWEDVFKYGAFTLTVSENPPLWKALDQKVLPTGPGGPTIVVHVQTEPFGIHIQASQPEG